MLVGVNTLTIEPGHGGGEEHYLRNVLVTMCQVQPDVRFVVFTDAVNHESFQGLERVCVGAGALGRVAGLEGPLERAAKRAGIDLLFTPLRTALSDSPVPQVLFTLGLIEYRKGPAQRRRAGVRMKAVKRTCKQAPAIVVPSRFLQQECLDVLDASLDKVVVAPLGVAGIFEEPQQGIAAKPYVLTVGNTHAFRNIGRLRQALDRLKDEMPHTLVVVGQTCEAEPEDWGPRVVRVDRCPTVHLAGLYQHCDVFICPSLYEGSGVTVLEAMRAGAPVAASRVGGIPEVAGDTPVYLNPESVSAMVAAMRRLLGEGATARQRRSRFGRQLAARYTWEDCAWKTLGAFRRV